MQLNAVLQGRPGTTPALGDARRAAARAGVRAAPAYLPCLLSWTRGRSTAEALERMKEAAGGWDPRSVLVSIDATAQLLLLAEDCGQAASELDLGHAVAAVVQAGCAESPGADLHAVVGERMTRDDPLLPVASRLSRIGRYELARRRDTLIWARGCALRPVLEMVDVRDASALVDDQLAKLAAYDREHGTDLQRVLELALDHDSRNEAASAAFMHRNTFRRQLRTALEFVDADLDCPEERLALHLALKLRALASA